MNLLISLCNISYLPKEYFLGVYNCLEQRLQYVELFSSNKESFPIHELWGATGIAKVENGYLVTTQGITNYIIYLDKNFNVVSYKALEIVKDTHSIAYNQGFVYVASTGNNSVIKLPFDNNFGEEQVYWTYENKEENVIHLNGITFLGNELIISCFGKKAGDKTIRSGFIKNITSNKILLEGIREPHNLTCYQDKLYVIESPTGCVYEIDRDNCEIVKEFAGYARGLAFNDEGDVFVVRNARRKSSRHIGGKKNVPLVDVTNDICEWEHAWICHSKCNERTYTKQDITAFAFEVYDLIVLDPDFESPNLIDFNEGISQKILRYENSCADLKHQLQKSREQKAKVDSLLSQCNQANQQYKKQIDDYKTQLDKVQKKSEE